MKNRLKLLGIIALIALIGFSAVSCKDDATKGATPKKYMGADPSTLDFYELEMGSEEGDSYTLNVYDKTGNLKGSSSGTISSVDGSVYTLSGGFTVTVSGDGITGFGGDRNAISGCNLPSTPVTPTKSGGDGSLNGTWKKGSETVTFSGSQFSYTNGSITAPGNAYYGGNVLVTYGTYGGEDWAVAGKYTLTPNTKINFIGFEGTMGSYYNGDWIKQ